MVGSNSLRELEFYSNPENINLIDSFVQELKIEFSLPDEMEANILVALSEAVNNAILHGNLSDPEKKVRITLMPDEQHLTFTIEDEGKGFNPGEVKDPTAPENLERPDGRGIFLMRHLADKIEFLEQGRKVVITFFRA